MYLVDAYYPSSAYPNEWPFPPATRGAVGWDVGEDAPTFINDDTLNPLYKATGITASDYYRLDLCSPALNAASDGSNIGANNANPGTPLPVSVSISPDNNNVCSGTTVNFTALPVNGVNPSYQWKVNRIIAGTNSITYFLYSCK